MRKASPDEIEIASIFGAVKANVRKLVLTSIALAALTYLVLMLIAPRYQSETELAIVASGISSAFNGSEAGGGLDSIATKMDKEAINTHVRALTSPDILEAVAAKLDLKDKPEFNAALGPVDEIGTIMRMVGLGGPRSGESERDRVLNVLRSRLEVYSAKESRFIGIRMTSIDPDLAANIANSVADTYRNSLADESVTEVDDQQKVIEGKIAKLTPELAALETEVERYRHEIDSFKGGSQNVGLNEQQMSELTAELVKVKGVRGEAEARARSAREMMKAGSADALPDVQKSPLIQNLVQQRVRIERQISELSATLLPGHPRMRQLNADLAGLKKQLRGEVGKLVESLEKEAKVAAGREASINKSLDELKARVTKNAPEEAKLRDLEADAKAKRTELENLRQRLEANRKKLDARVAPVEVKIISEAQPASVPVFPKKTSLSALVAVASLIFGTAWTVLKALFLGARGAPMAPARTTTSGVRSDPVLPAAPTSGERVSKEPARVSVLPETPTRKTETVTTMADLVQRIASHRPGQAGFRTLITGETSAVSAAKDALALCRGLSEKPSTVILVNWSASGRSIESEAGVLSPHGFTELILGKVGFDEAVHRIPGTAVHFIPCGASFSDAKADVEPDQLNLVLDALDEAYDHIVVVGSHDEARFLFEAIQGRFDAGIVVADENKPDTALSDPPGSFLGFEVAEIDVIRYRSATLPAATGQRIVRSSRQPEWRPGAGIVAN